MTRTLRIAAATCLMGLLSGCDNLEAYQNNTSWHPTGANAANLAAEVVNPVDLTYGQPAAPSDGLAAAAAIDRLRHDHVKPLPDGDSITSAVPTPAAGLTSN
jgi:type IV pilus biogenesis protein CpaD/CtpE